MRTALVALTALLAGLTIPAANAAVDDPGGVGCSFAAITDPTAEPGTFTGVLSGGPLVITDSTTNLPGSGTLTCHIQVNVADHTGTGPSVSGHGTGVVTAGPGEVSLTAGADDNIYVCMEFTDDSTGTTYYWDPVHGTWSTSNRGPCGLAGVAQQLMCTVGSFTCAVYQAFKRDNLDPLVCPILWSLAPGVPGVVDIGADGDLYVGGSYLYDCPPY